jgi:hypothetical protein
VGIQLERQEGQRLQLLDLEYAQVLLAPQKGATKAAIAAKKKEMEKMKAMYNNPFINAAITLIEPFPVGLVVTLSRSLGEQHLRSLA